MINDSYKELFCIPNLMGPNSLRVLDALLEEYPLHFSTQENILDLGCGSGMTSLFIANETGARVYANDLWVSAEDNRKRFEKWGKADQILPVHEDANNLSFDKDMFQAIISIDAYHYFAGKEGFFEQKILPYVKKGGMVLIGIPGIKEIYSGRSQELLSSWLGDEAYMFQSKSFWKKIIGNHAEIETVRTWELNCFDLAWSEWLDTKHEYTAIDSAYFDSVIKPYTTFVGIMVKKKSF